MRSDDLVHLACFSKLVRLNLDSLCGPVEARQINHLGRLTNLQELRILFAGHGLEQNLLVCLACICMHACLCVCITGLRLLFPAVEVAVGVCLQSAIYIQSHAVALQMAQPRPCTFRQGMRH